MKSATLLCKRMKGTQDFKAISQILSNTYRQFGIEDKVIRYVTDNGSNFVKAFQSSGENGCTWAVNANETEEVEFIEIGNLDFRDNIEYNLPLHFPVFLIR